MIAYKIFDTLALAFVSDEYDHFIEAYRAAQDHSPSALVVAVEKSA